MSKELYILGHPVSHSKSPAMYNAAYGKLGLGWHYGFADEPTHDTAREFISRRKYLSINITTPYKPEAYEAADIKAATAKLAKGVNLLVNKDDKLIGYNVDGQGCIAYLEREGVAFKEKKVVVCGTGPTALSILHESVQAGASEVLLLGRDKERAKRVMDRYVSDYHRLASTAIPLPSPNPDHLGFLEAFEHARFKYGTYETSRKALSEADVIIDATVLGMSEGDPAPFDTSLLHSGQVVMDTVYGHGETETVRAAKEAGCRTFDGAGMLVAQAAITSIILCEVENVDAEITFDWLFDIMADAAGFSL